MEKENGKWKMNESRKFSFSIFSVFINQLSSYCAVRFGDFLDFRAVAI